MPNDTLYLSEIIRNEKIDALCKTNSDLCGVPVIEAKNLSFQLDSFSPKAKGLTITIEEGSF